MKILCVDDEAECRRLLISLVGTRPGWEIVTLEEGSEAWWLLADPGGNDFDVLITDIRMPKYSGVELLRRIRATPRLQPLHVIVSSGVQNREEVLQIMQLGNLNYVLKPFLPRTMLDRLDAIAAEIARRRIAMDLDVS